MIHSQYHSDVYYSQRDRIGTQQEYTANSAQTYYTYIEASDVK